MREGHGEERAILSAARRAMAQCLAARVTADDETLEDLGVGRETVRRHVAPIYGKLGSPSRLELARLIHPKGAS